MALYSAVRTSDSGLYHVSGQLPDDCGASLAEQTEQALANVGKRLEEKGYGKDSILKVGIMTTEIESIADINAAYEKFFEGVAEMPARSAFGVTGLVNGAKVEIDCVGQV